VSPPVELLDVGTLHQKLGTPLMAFAVG